MYYTDMIKEVIIILSVVVFILFRLVLRYRRIANELKRQKQSLAVRHGMDIEKFIPFMKGFPYEPSKCVFIGKPIDYIVFDDDKIVFVEIKTSNSRLSEKEKNIKDIVLSRKVEYKEIRI